MSSKDLSSPAFDVCLHAHSALLQPIFCIITALIKRTHLHPAQQPQTTRVAAHTPEAARQLCCDDAVLCMPRYDKSPAAAGEKGGGEKGGNGRENKLVYGSATCSSSSRLCSGSARVIGMSNASISLRNKLVSCITLPTQQHGSKTTASPPATSHLATSGLACCLRR